jgi:LysM repeat protein
MRRLVAAVIIPGILAVLWVAFAQPATARHGIGNDESRFGGVQGAQLATATPFPVPTAGPETTYVVQPGDNLYRIAVRFGTTIQALIISNGLSDAGAIVPGQTLIIPGGNYQPPAPPITLASNVPFALGITASSSTQAASQIRELGAGWTKLTLYWSDLQPQPDQQNEALLTALENAINALNTAGIRVLLTVSRAPDWTRATAPGTLAESGPPTDFSTVGTFFNNLAGLLKERVAAYEVWEQPNLKREWNGKPLNGASYVELLTVAYGAIKQADPAALVISAGLAPTGLNDGINAVSDRVYLQQMYSAGVAEVSDAIGAQPDGAGNPPDSTCCTASVGVSGWFNDRSFYFRDTLTDYRQIMVQNNDGGTLLWVTRFGWGASEGVVNDPTAVNPALGFVNFTSQIEQAQYVTRGFEIGRSLGYIGPMFLYNLDTCPALAQGSTVTVGDVAYEPCYFSLLDTSGNPRPVFAAVKAARK